MTPVARAAYGLYAAALVLMSAPQLGALRGLGPAIQLGDLVFAAAAAVWFVALLRRDVAVPRAAVWIAVAGYFAAGVLSLVATPSLRGSTVKLLGVAYLVTIMVMTASFGSAAGGWRRVLVPWVVAAGVTGALGVVSAVLFYADVRDPASNPFLWGYGSVPVGNYPRIAVFFANANMLASYLVVGAGAAGALLPFVHGRARVATIAAAAAIGVASVFTLSAGVGGLAIAVAVTFIAVRRRAGRAVAWQSLVAATGAAGAALLLAFLSVVLMVPKGQGQVTFGPVDLDFSASGRVSNWRGAIDTVRAHPLVGKGIGTLVAPTANPRAFHSMEEWGTAAMRTDTAAHPMEAHNVWLNVAGQLGLPGFVAMVALVVLLARGLWPPSGTDDPLARARIAVAATLVGAFLYHGLFAAVEDARQIWYLFGLCVAAKAQADHQAEEAHAALPRVASRPQVPQ